MAKDLVSLYHITSYYIILHHITVYYELVVQNQAPGTDWAWLSIAIMISYQPIDVYSACLAPFATKEARSHHPRAYCHRRPYLAHHPAWCQLDPCHLSTKAITLLVQFLREMTWSFNKHVTLKTMGTAVLLPKKNAIWVLRFDQGVEIRQPLSCLATNLHFETRWRGRLRKEHTALFRRVLQQGLPQTIPCQSSAEKHNGPNPSLQATPDLWGLLHATKRYPFWGSKSK